MNPLMVAPENTFKAKVTEGIKDEEHALFLASLVSNVRSVINNDGPIINNDGSVVGNDGYIINGRSIR